MRTWRSLFLFAPVLYARRGAAATGRGSLVSLLPSEQRREHSQWANTDRREELISRLSTMSKGSDRSRLEWQVDTFYLPLYLHLKSKMLSRRKEQGNTSGPLFVGISAPQGCGKTTLTTLMEYLFEKDSYSCVSCSLDDFYLTGEAQDALALAHPTEPLLQYRGNAGTHDMPLMLSTLRLLKQGGGKGREGTTTGLANLRVPRYDKSLRGGRGDRAPDEEWRNLGSNSPDIVLFEGWMLGFEPLPDSDIKDPALRVVNGHLRSYAPLHALFDTWLVLAVDTVDHVYKWRLQAEQNMGLQGKPRLSDDQVADFVNRFMPAYKAYLPSLYSLGPNRGPGVTVTKINVAEDRSVVGAVAFD